MAFIEKQDPVVINIKLTSRGRELLSSGKLTFDYYAVGDSEIDYGFIHDVISGDSTYSASQSNILRPADKNPAIISFITKTVSGDTGFQYNAISSAPSSYQVTNSVDPIGFFINSATTFNTDSNHVKQPDAMINMSGVTGGTSIRLVKAPSYGTSAEEPIVGDFILVKWSYGISTTGHTITSSYATPFLIYKIESIISGTLAADNLVVTVDREIPDFTQYAPVGYCGAMIYYNFINYSGNTIFGMSSTEYLDESVLSFLQNSQCPTIVFPFWNMTIAYTEEIAGVQVADKKYAEFTSRTYAGFISYIQNQAPVYKKLGIIHYTNSSPANVYGEGFYLKTPVLDVPTIMWHKSATNTLGARFVPSGSSKLLTGSTVSLNTPYYDLADINGNIVGKVFNDLKIFVIEDQELLFAMSYKSNRNWTFPRCNVSTSGSGCD